MLRWIAELLGRKQENIECVKTIGQDGVQVRISRFPLDCGHPGYLVELYTYLELTDKWVPCGIFGGREVHALLPLMAEVAAYMDQVGSRPIVFAGED